MNVLMISGDRSILDPGSGAGKRLALQRAHVERLDVFVWPQIHSWREILVAAKKTNYSVVTAQDPFWRGLLAWKIARRTGAKSNIQVHADLSAQSFLRRVLAHFVLARADSIRVVSERAKHKLIAAGVHAPITVLPIYIDVSRFALLKQAPHEGKNILWIGRFEQEKDPLLALSILGQVRTADSNAKLIMLGAGSLGSRLRSEANKRNLPVEFPGWQDPATYLPTADLVLSTSRAESYGASFIEALAMGVPVVAPDVGVAREAGAIIASRDALASAVIGTLHSDARGKLLLALPSAQVWAERWRAMLG